MAIELNRIEQVRRKLRAEGQNFPEVNLSSGTSADAGEFGMHFPQEILADGFGNFQNLPTYQADPKGQKEAREAVAQFYRERGFIIPPENILLTSGTSESYLHLFKLLAAPGEEILFPNPSYPLFDHIAKLADITLKHYFLDEDNEWQINLPDLESKISSKTKAIVLISPNNPTGSVLSAGTLKGVLALAKKHRLPIISDEVFSEFMFEGKTFPRAANLADAPAVTIFTLNGISKTYALPGLKLGWVVATGPRAEEYLEELEISVDTLLACNQISQAMLPTIMTKGEAFLKTFRDGIEKNRNAAIQILSKSPNITFNQPQGGFYLFAQIRNFPGTDEDFVIRMLERERIFVHPGYFYDYEKAGSNEEWSGLHVLISFVMEAGELSSTLGRFVRAADLLCVSDNLS